MLVPTSGSRTALTLGGDGDRLHLSLSQLLITASTLIYPQWNDVIRSPAEWRRERQMTENEKAERYNSLMDNGLKPKSWIRHNTVIASVKEEKVLESYLGHFHMCFEIGNIGFRKNMPQVQHAIFISRKFRDLGQTSAYINFILNVKFYYGCGILMVLFCLESLRAFTRGPLQVPVSLTQMISDPTDSEEWILSEESRL